MAITGLCTVVFAMQAALGEAARWDMLLGFSMIPAVVTGDRVLPAAIPTLGAAFSLLSAMFLHADFWHLAGNMMLLWLLGDGVEGAMGHLRFIVFYLLCGLGRSRRADPARSRIARSGGGGQRRHFRRARRRSYASAKGTAGPAAGPSPRRAAGIAVRRRCGVVRHPACRGADRRPGWGRGVAVASGWFRSRNNPGAAVRPAWRSGSSDIAVLTYIMAVCAAVLQHRRWIRVLPGVRRRWELKTGDGPAHRTDADRYGSATMQPGRGA